MRYTIHETENKITIVNILGLFVLVKVSSRLQ